MKTPLVVLATAVVLSLGGVVYAAQSTVSLQTTAPFAVLAGTGITNVATSAIIGNVGLHPGSGAAMTGLGCLEVTGTIYDRDGTFPGTCEVTNDGLLNAAKVDLVAAYDDAAGRTPFTTVANELGGTTKTPGVYRTATQFGITAGAGPLILDAQGDSSGVFIFQMQSGATGLVVGPGSVVQLTGGAQACNVFWKLNTATIDTTAVFKGTILALTQITVANGADIEGRLLARNANVTLISDSIRRPTCVAASSGSSGTTPTLPNAGASFGQRTSMLWDTAFPAGIIASFFSLYLLRKRRSG